MELCTASVAAQYLDIADVYAGDHKLFVEVIPAAKMDSLNEKESCYLISEYPVNRCDRPKI